VTQADLSNGPKRATMLTIGQLAAYVGVTVRAVRHYHQCGLLAEPLRDASGYRCYDAQAVVDLIRIKTLSDAGVPLTQIDALLNAQPEEFALAVARINDALTMKIRDLQRHQQRIGELVAGERLFLPTEVVDYLDQLRALGVSARSVQIERDGWILILTRFPEQVAEWVRQKGSYLEDAEFRDFYLIYDQAFDWDPADPRLEELVEAVVDFMLHRQQKKVQLEKTVENSAIGALLAAHLANLSPAWDRLGTLVEDRLLAAASVEPAASVQSAASVSPEGRPVNSPS
jgi:DNA-binding transcriptional MerR regulator